MAEQSKNSVSMQLTAGDQCLVDALIKRYPSKLDDPQTATMSNGLLRQLMLDIYRFERIEKEIVYHYPNLLTQCPNVVVTPDLPPSITLDRPTPARRAR